MLEQITPEVAPEPEVVPPLDESLLVLSDEQMAFLRDSVTQNDADLKTRLIEVQKEYVSVNFPAHSS